MGGSQLLYVVHRSPQVCHSMCTACVCTPAHTHAHTHMNARKHTHARTHNTSTRCPTPSQLHTKGSSNSHPVCSLPEPLTFSSAVHLPLRVSVPSLITVKNSCKYSSRQEFISARGLRVSPITVWTAWAGTRGHTLCSQSQVPGLALPGSGRLSHAQLKLSGDSLPGTCRGASPR